MGLNAARRKLDVAKMHCARVGPGLVAKFKSWGTTPDRDFVVGVHFNAEVSAEAIHKALGGALQETHPSMKCESPSCCPGRS